MGRRTHLPERDSPVEERRCRVGDRDERGDGEREGRVDPRRILHRDEVEKSRGNGSEEDCKVEPFEERSLLRRERSRKVKGEGSQLGARCGVPRSEVSVWD